MRMKKQNKPRIRFNKFTDDWEQRGLGEVLTERNVQHPQNKEYPLVSFTVENGVTPKTDRYEREQLVRGDKSQKKYKATELDDIVYNPANLKFGAIARNKYGKAVFSPIYVTFEVNEKVALPMYVERFITRQDFIQYSLQYQQGTVYERQSVNPEDLLSLGISLPSIDEQKVIGKLFDSIDHLITLHQRKIEQLEITKKIFLNKMFPKGKAVIPEYRFKGFADDWEQRKLGEISDNFEYGLNAAAVDYDGKNKYLRITDIDDNSRLFNQDDLTSPNINFYNNDNYILSEGDILFARTGASVGKSYLYHPSDGLVYYAGFLIRARINENFDYNFIFQNTLTSNYNKYIEITSQRSGQPGVNAKEFQDFLFYSPQKEEQEQIGSFFKELDNLITLHQRKVDNLELMKKYFLKNMFV